MNAESTMEIELESIQMRTISSGTDGEALIGYDGSGNCFELKALLRANEDRLSDLHEQFSLLRITDHSSIRSLIDWSKDDGQTSVKLAVPSGLDPYRDRLCHQLESLSLDDRLGVAAQIVDATAAAHRVGLCHGSFASSTILIGDSDGTRVSIDFSGTACSYDVVVDGFSVEADLENLAILLGTLLRPVVDVTSGDDSSLLGGRQRAMVKKWISEWQPGADALPPTIGQWQSILEPFNLNLQPADKTGVVIPAMPIHTRSDNSSSHGTSSNHGITSTHETLVPDRLGRFELHEMLGEGGMGTVYRGVDLSTDETVAVKVLRNTGSDVGQSIRRFRKEARLLADVQNEHVTRLIDVGEDKGHHFLVMEYVEGINLKEWFSARGQVSEAEALSIIADLARALVDAHSREVIHRDVKPENVLMQLRENHQDRSSLGQLPSNAFTLKLTDFGIARHVNQSESMEVTRSGSVLGTPKYMSPEQCKSTESPGPSSDVYSIGVTLFELLTGSAPFESNDAMKLAAMHCFDSPPAIQSRNPKVSDQAARIVERSLAKDPNDRFGDAGQLLAEVLRCLRGESAGFEVHPKLPSHNTSKLWEKTISWNLKSSPAELWPYVSNTERLNEAIGLPPAEYSTRKDPQRGIRRFGSFKLSGIKISWEEHPFEWIEGHRMGILREFDAGPFKWFMSVVTMEAVDGGTKLSHQVRIQPRNLLGRLLTTVEADWKGFRSLTKVYSRIDRAIQGRRVQKHDAFKAVSHMSRSQAQRLDQRLGDAVELGVEPDMAAAIKSALTQWSAQDLASLRPIAMADRLGVDSEQIIDACLIAASRGILNLRWDILCPTCQASAATRDKLSEIQSHTNCEACDTDFQSNLASAIEMVFSAHPEIREINEGQYCIGGPEHAPHVLAQIRLEPGECLELVLDLGPGDYLVRGTRLSRTQSLCVQHKSAPSCIDLTLSELGRGNHTPKLRAGRQTLTLANDEELLHVIRVERMIPRDDVITAAAASTNPLFRQLFPHQQFSRESAIETETMTFLATGLNNVDSLYSIMGDAGAYQLIRKENLRLEHAVVQCGGVVVKTIGEQMLAAFQRRDQALDAIGKIRTRTCEENESSLELGIGVHCGPTLVTTQNNQIDYFGLTVRSVMALPERAGSESLITESVYSDPAATNWMDGSLDTVEVIDLPGNPNQRVKRIPKA